jgi:hypothetical protein
MRMKERYARQVRLAEVGEAGQARFASRELFVRGEGTSSVVEARYLAGAGCGRLVVTNEEVARAAREVDPALQVSVLPELAARDGDDASETAFADLSPSARGVAIGAYRALAAFRSTVLSLEGDSGP